MREMAQGSTPIKDKRDGGNASALPNDVVKLALVVRNSRTHLALEGLHWKNFHPHVDAITNIEGKVLDEEIVRNEGILAELNLDCDAILNEVRLIVAEDRRLACGFYLALLLGGRHGKRLTD